MTQRDRFIAGERVERAEIIVGLVGALGTDIDAVQDKLAAALVRVRYSTTLVRVSALIHDEFTSSEQTLGEPETKLDALMDQGDRLRRDARNGAAAAALAVMSIARSRREAGVTTGDREGHASIIRQLKHPDEVRLLRSVYGPRFVLIGIWSPRSERESVEIESLRRDQPGKEPSWYSDQMTRLLGRDEKDGNNNPLGQRVRDTFRLADAYVASIPGHEESRELERIVDLLFGSPYVTPTPEEQAMCLAEGARLRSADAGRQVGAVVVDDEGEVLVTGVNEVPKAGGGQYWPSDVPDHRDFQLGHDVNERIKTALVTDLLQLLKNAGDWLAEGRQSTGVYELTLQALAGPLEDSRIKDLLEFGRVAHAEMAAISTAARRGTAIGGMTLMSTTYPCHECARLIIASGIKRVVYVDPYPKSQVPAMYRHQIKEDPLQGPGSVIFEPFRGIAPRLYRTVFAMPTRPRDDVTGEFARWKPEASVPRRVAEADALYPVQSMEDPVTEEFGNAMVDAGWWASEDTES